MLLEVTSDKEASYRMAPWEYVHPEFLVNDADAVDDAAGTCGSDRWVSRWTKLTGAFRGTIKFHAHCIPLECSIVVDIYEPGRYNCDFTHESDPTALQFSGGPWISLSDHGESQQKVFSIDRDPLWQDTLLLCTCWSESRIGYYSNSWSLHRPPWAIEPWTCEFLNVRAKKWIECPFLMENYFAVKYTCEAEAVILRKFCSPCLMYKII